MALHSQQGTARMDNERVAPGRQSTEPTIHWPSGYLAGGAGGGAHEMEAS